MTRRDAAARPADADRPAAVARRPTGGRDGADGDAAARDPGSAPGAPDTPDARVAGPERSGARPPASGVADPTRAGPERLRSLPAEPAVSGRDGGGPDGSDGDRAAPARSAAGCEVLGADAPRDHRAALARIPSERMAALTALSDVPGLTRLASHLGLLAATGAAVMAAEGWVRLGAQAAHGAVLVFLFAACHECIHRTAFRTRWLNDAVAHGAGFLILLPAHWFRFFHFAHHRFTQDPARDPELATPKPRTVAGYLRALTGWDYWRGMAAATLGAALGRPLPSFVPPRGEGRVRGEARAFLALYALILAASLAAGSALAWELWVLPALLGQPWLRAFVMAEHTGLPTVPDMLENSRTTFASRAVRWISWEMPHHTAHHAQPAAPFHALPALTAELRARLRRTARDYRDAHRQILAALPGRG
jgi:fatty acid desaturase